jgi:tRNA(adenine34) deaminase
VIADPVMPWPPHRAADGAGRNQDYTMDDRLPVEPWPDGDPSADAWPESLAAALTGTAADAPWMRLALEEARQAAAADEVPVGAVVVAGGHVIASAHNQREQLRDPTAHAEMIALTQAAAAIGSWRLEGCTLYVTLEPCPMCAGAILQARVPRVVWGAMDPKAGAVVSLYRLFEDPRLNHRVEHTGHVLADECGGILTEFFRAKRRPAP